MPTTSNANSMPTKLGMILATRNARALWDSRQPQRRKPQRFPILRLCVTGLVYALRHGCQAPTGRARPQRAGQAPTGRAGSNGPGVKALRFRFMPYAVSGSPIGLHNIGRGSLPSSADRQPNNQ